MRLIVLIALHVTLCGSVHASDLVTEGQERLDKFFAVADEVRQSFQVTARVITVSRGHDAAVADSKYSEVLLKKITAPIQGKPVTRFEMSVTNPLIQGAAVIYEHDLIFPDKVLYGWDTRPVRSIEEFKNPREARADDNRFLDPYLSALEGTTTNWHERAEANWRKCRIYDAVYLKDRRVRCYLMHENGKGSAYITFALKPDWLIEECRVFGNPGEPINYLEFDKKDIAHWEAYSGQQIKWLKLKDDTWVPEKVVTWSKQEKYSEEIEIQFRGWRLGKDVQLEQLDEKRFVPELIHKDTSFAEIEADFLQHSNRTR